MECPNCKIELIEHMTGKDTCFQDGNGNDLYLGRIIILSCPKCGYYDEQTLTTRK